MSQYEHLPRASVLYELPCQLVLMETSATAPELEMDATALELDTYAATLDLEMETDVPQEISKQERYSADYEWSTLKLQLMGQH
jgi:hypothetical protein